MVFIGIIPHECIIARVIMNNVYYPMDSFNLLIYQRYLKLQMLSIDPCPFPVITESHSLGSNIHQYSLANAATCFVRERVNSVVVPAGIEPTPKNFQASTLPMSHAVLIRSNANKESLVEVTGLKESSFLIVFFDGMKVVIWLRIERVQRIIAIQGVSLVRILNFSSLNRSVARSIEILPPSLLPPSLPPPSLSCSGRIYGSSLSRPPVLPYWTQKVMSGLENRVVKIGREGE